MSFSKELLLAALRGHTDKPIDPIGKELREDLKECEPKPAGPGGGVSSWKNLPGKPVTVSGGDTLTWDGNTDGKIGVSVSIFDTTFTYYHVSDAVPTESDVIDNSGVKLGSSDGLVYGYDEMILDFYEDGSALINFLVYIIPHDGYVVDTDEGSVTFDKKGVYFAGIESGYMSFFTIPGYTGFTKEVLKPDILPKALQFGDYPTGGDTLTWDGNTVGHVTGFEGMLVKVSDAVPVLSDFSNGGHVVMNGETQTFAGGEITEEMVSPEGVISAAGFFMVPPNCAGVPLESMDGQTFPEPGTYFMNMPGNMVCTELHIDGYTGFSVMKKLDAKYLPTTKLLYLDETYIYRTNDIVDGALNPDARISAGELKALIKGGCNIVITNPAGTVFAQIINAQFQYDYGMLTYSGNMGNGGTYTATQRFTAEYTPT